MRHVNLEIVLHGAVMRLPFESADYAAQIMDKLRPLIGQRHAYKNGGRDHIFAVETLEGRTFICVDDVQAIGLVEPRRQLLLKARAAIDEGETYAKAFSE